MFQLNAPGFQVALPNTPLLIPVSHIYLYCAAVIWSRLPSLHHITHAPPLLHGTGTRHSCISRLLLQR